MNFCQFDKMSKSRFHWKCSAFFWRRWIRLQDICSTGDLILTAGCTGDCFSWHSCVSGMKMPQQECKRQNKQTPQHGGVRERKRSVGLDALEGGGPGWMLATQYFWLSWRTTSKWNSAYPMFCLVWWWFALKQTVYSSDTGNWEHMLACF